MLGKKRNFKSRSDYHEWLAYGHIHEVYDDGPGRKEFFVGTKRKKPRPMCTSSIPRVLTGCYKPPKLKTVAEKPR